MRLAPPCRTTSHAATASAPDSVSAVAVAAASLVTVPSLAVLSFPCCAHFRDDAPDLPGRRVRAHPRGVEVCP
jgi:hypothetical protein